MLSTITVFSFFFFFFNDTAPTEIYTLSLHDALPISRQWTPGESSWIGWERRGGKLEEFNRLLRGAKDTSFRLHVGDPEVLPSVRYCITLDSDTRLPLHAARKLIGIIAHPLNRPSFDPRLRRVTEGYGILQPRV